MNIRALVAASVVMGVLIIGGVGILVFTIVHRLAAPATAQALTLLDEPPGTRIQSIATAGERLAILLQGAGADRILLIDPRTGQVAGRVGLAH